MIDATAKMKDFVSMTRLYIDIIDGLQKKLEETGTLKEQNKDLAGANRKMHRQIIEMQGKLADDRDALEDLQVERERLANANKSIYDLQVERDQLKGSIKSLKGEITKLRKVKKCGCKE